MRVFHSFPSNQVSCARYLNVLSFILYFVLHFYLPDKLILWITPMSARPSTYFFSELMYCFVLFLSVLDRCSCVFATELTANSTVCRAKNVLKWETNLSLYQLISTFGFRPARCKSCPFSKNAFTDPSHFVLASESISGFSCSFPPVSFTSF